MALPIVYFLESHSDTTTNKAIEFLFDDLRAIGYNTFCVEEPCDLTPQEIVAKKVNKQIWNEKRLQFVAQQIGETRDLSTIETSELYELLQRYASNDAFLLDVQNAFTLKGLKMSNRNLQYCLREGVRIVGVDIKYREKEKVYCWSVRSQTQRYSEENKKIQETLGIRDQSMFEGLVKCKEKGQNIVFLSGAAHVKGVMERLQKRGMAHAVLCYFPFSKGHLPKDILDDFHKKTDNFCREIMFPLTDKKIEVFCAKVLKDITRELPYDNEILDKTIHSLFLAHFFQTEVRTFIHPGSFSDALVLYSEGIEKKLPDGVETFTIEHEGKKYLVIPHINTTQVATQIHSMRA